MLRNLLLSLLLAGAAASAQSGSSDLDFLHGLSDFRNIRRMLPEWLDAQAEHFLLERRAAIANISDADAFRARQRYVRETITRLIGGFPEKTPLNAHVTGTLERDGYRIEKVIFESQPKFFVTANLYVPTRGRGPYPAVLFPLGHETGGKANQDWQHVLVTLARRGYVLLAWDPLGQGERVQNFDPDWEDSKVRPSTTEHSELGIECLLVGDALARYTIWDGIRALDYLLSRPEVDPKRVAATGNSGGGTHTSYISALDDRIQVAAPSCYITSWSRLLKSLGPQDAEQNFPGFMQAGLDFPDFLYGFGLKPFLVMSAIRDFFPIMGARQSFAEAKSVFSRLGAGDRVAMFEADDGHGYTAPRRAAGYEWLGRWLKDNPDREPEAPVKPELPSDLYCTPTGQAATSLHGEDVFTLNQKRAAALRNARRHENAVKQARVRSGFDAPSGPVQVTPYGTIIRSGFRIEKLTYDSERGIRIPALIYVPDGGAARKPAILVADGAGKSASRERQERFARAGYVVLAIDARGLGETRPDVRAEAYFGDYGSAMTAILLGKTLVGMRARDIVRGIDVLAARPDVDPGRIYGYAKDLGTVPMLHAAAFDPRLNRIALERMLVSYDAVVNHRIHRGVFEQVVPGALRDYDLPDLAASLGNRPLWLVNAVDPVGNPLRVAEVQKSYPRATIREVRLEESPSAVWDDLLR